MNTRIQKLLLPIYALCVALMHTKVAYAGDEFETGDVQAINNPIDIDNIPDFIAAITDAIVRLALPVIGVFVIYSGFLFVMAQGNSEKLSNAKRVLTFTLVGAAVILGADLIADVVAGTLGDLGAVVPE